MTNQVLLIEDDDAMRLSIAQTLTLEEYTVIQANGLDQAKRAIRANFNGVILSDIRMPLQDGFEVLKYVQAIDTNLPVVMLTGEADVPTALKAMKAGAYDFLEKPCSTKHLLSVLQRALDFRKLVIRNRTIESRINTSDGAAINFPGISNPTKGLQKQLRNIAKQNVHVHITGDEGVGKKLAAYTIHSLAIDRDKIHSINFKNARHGNLQEMKFLQVPCDITLKNFHLADADQHDKLLDIIERNPNLRVLSSSIEDVQNCFESDLLKKLNPISIHVPNLRARRKDLAAIFESVLRLTSRSLNSDMPEITLSMLATVQSKDWNGNLPEMRDFARQVILDIGADSQQVEHVALADQMDAFEKRILQDALRRNNGRATITAEQLGLPRKTFYDRLTRYDIQPKDFKSTSAE